MRLRKLKEKDTLLMLEWMNNKEINQCFRIPISSMTLEKVTKFIIDSYTEENKHFAIVDSNGEYMGTISLKNINVVPLSAEYAIVLRECAIGQGYAAFATNEILKFAFNQLNLDKVFLNVLVKNKRAIAFYEKFGFVYEPNYKLYEMTEIDDQSLTHYSIDKAKFNTLNK